MRILMLAQFYPPDIGGEERHVRNLSIELVSRGHEVAVATFCLEGQPELEIDQGVRVYRIHTSMQRASFLFSNKARPHAPPFPDPEALWSLRRVILHECPDIIHAHNWIVHSFLPLKAWSKAKLVVTLHDYSLLCATKRLMYKDTVCSGPKLQKCLKCTIKHYGAVKGVLTTLTNAISARAERNVVDMFLPVSQAVAEGTQLTKHGVRHRMIPNFVPNDLSMTCDHTSPLLTQLPQENYLLFVGDIMRDKGVEVLLRAYAELESLVPLVLIGRSAANFSMDLPPNVIRLQSWPHSAVMSAWSRCMVALVPSIWPDPCPTVAMEAMTFGKPIVASRIGGLSDIINDGETGFLVAPGNAHALCEGIRCLLDDPVRREYMSGMAKQRVVEFQARAVVPRIEQVYQEVM
ncbi:MAG TPA: glycosyltransferase family 4 protein [Ktedonobacteraceae bacterium]|nr:glycosyltransferase family 4 protein [Ktedonobacteraceae bacterium]